MKPDRDNLFYDDALFDQLLRDLELVSQFHLMITSFWSFWQCQECPEIHKPNALSVIRYTQIY